MLLSAVVTMLALQVTPAQAQRIAWVPNPRRTDRTWVADPSGHLSAAARAAVNATIDSLERATGAEIAVVVVDSLSGLTPFDFALAIHRTWGVGKAGKDNGVVLLWVPTERAVQISVGYGLEGVIPDRVAGRIRDGEIFPAFRRGEFDAGVLAGVRALAAAAASETNARQGFTPRMQGAEGEGPSSGHGIPFLVWLLGGAAVVGGGGTAGLIGWRRRRPRRCPKCGTAMARLDEQADDAYLDQGQQAEERVRSVDYDVWLCPSCHETLTLPYRRWLSSYTECPRCKRRTLRSTSKTIRAATTLSEGLSRVTMKCGNCDFAAEKEVAIPRVTPSSSGGSSSSGGGGGGGGSFGGGSAGGGGAGGRY